MTVNFPTSLDSFTNPTPPVNPLYFLARDGSVRLKSDPDTIITPADPALVHSTVESQQNDAIEALETKVGINGSADTNSLDYKVANKQNTLVSGTNIKTVNGNSLLGSGDISISGTAAWGSITGTLSTQTDLQTALDGKVDENASITGATKTKITYDAKGLVTVGADATTADIAESGNLYFTDERAQDAVGTILTDSSTVDFTYNDGAATITAAVIANSSTQKIEVTKNSSAVVGTRKQLNFVEGSNITLTISDDAGNDQVDVTIASSGGGSGITLGLANMSYAFNC